jgi:hypothetical protein
MSAFGFAGRLLKTERCNVVDIAKGESAMSIPSRQGVELNARLRPYPKKQHHECCTHESPSSISHARPLLGYAHLDAPSGLFLLLRLSAAKCLYPADQLTTVPGRIGKEGVHAAVA